MFGRAFGRFKCWSVSVLLFSSCFYLCAFLPFSGLAHSFYLSHLLFSSWYLPFCLGMFYLALVYFLGRFIVLSIFYYCSALFMYSLFLYILCVLILLCFGRDFCFLFFRSYSRGLFLPRRAFNLFCFVIVVVSAFCSMQCGLVSHHLSLIGISVFFHGHF